MPAYSIYLLIDTSAYQNATTASAVQTRLNWLLGTLKTQRNTSVNLSVLTVTIGSKTIQPMTNVAQIDKVVLPPATGSICALTAAVKKILNEVEKAPQTSPDAIRHLYVVSHRPPIPKYSKAKNDEFACFTGVHVLLLEGTSPEDFRSLTNDTVQSSPETLFSEITQVLAPNTSSGSRTSLRPTPKKIGTTPLPAPESLPPKKQPSSVNSSSGTQQASDTTLKPTVTRQPSVNETSSANQQAILVGQNKALQIRVKELEKELEEAKKQKQQLTTSSQAQNDRVKELETMLQDAKKAQLNAKTNTNLEKRIKELEEKLKAAESSYTQLTKTSQAQDAKVKELETKLKASETQNSQLSNSSQAQYAKVKELEAKLQAAESQQAHLSSSSQLQDTKVKELEARLQAATATSDAFKKQFEEATKSQVQHQKEKAALEAKLQDAIADKELLEKKLASLKEEHDKLLADTAEYRQRVAAKNAEDEKAKKRREAEKAKKDELTKSREETISGWDLPTG